MAVKCALAGGVLGLLLGGLSALLTIKEEGGGALGVVDGVLQVVVWGFGLAFLGGGMGYVSMYFAERKLGLAPEVDHGPDQIIVKASYLRGLQTETEKTYLDISARVAAANQHLAAAEKEFNDGAFAPFWDEIERAANQLAAYKNEVEHLHRNVGAYNAEAGELVRLGGDAVAPLVVPMNQLPDARPSATRFMNIVRKAQTNFEFAMIFEQRKTNQLLHTGFGNLGAAIHSLGESINASLDKLSRSVEMNADQILSYQAPIRHMLSKTATRGKKPAESGDMAKRLPRFDPNQN